MPILGIIASSQQSAFIATGAYESIATTTVGSGGSASITFSSIPATYTHLQLRVFARSTDSGSSNIEFDARFNSDSSGNYANHYIYATGSGTPSAFSAISQTYLGFQRISGGSATSGVFGTIILDILDYANTNKNKTIKQVGGIDNNGSGVLAFVSGLWMSTSAINTIQVYPNTGNFAQYSQVALYGIKGA